MESTAVLRNVQIGPKKVRLVADMIRGKKAKNSVDVLRYTEKKAAVAVGKVLKSAIANAENNLGLKGDTLVIKEIKVDEARMLKRIKPRARGQADRIVKRASHITVVLGEI